MASGADEPARVGKLMFMAKIASDRAKRIEVGAERVSR